MMSPRPGDPSTWLAATLDALPVAVVLADVDGRLVAANRMAVRLLAIPPEVTKLTEVVTLDGIPGLAEAVSVARAEGGTQRIGDIALGPAGERFDLTVGSVIDGDRCAGVAFTVEPRAGPPAARMGDGEPASILKFLAMLAHELRNPLGPVVSALHVIRAQVGADAQMRRVVQIADRQLRHQARLLDDLLDVSRVVHDKVVLKIEPVDLVALVRQAVDDSTPAIRGRAHAVELRLPDQPVVVGGDATRLEQVLRNLLGNAVKFTPPGGRITVTVARERETAVVTVSDTGVGIAADMQSRVFDLFVQGDPSLARSQGGLGIGLTLVRRLVELHGGTVRASSAGPQRGSTFEVRVPLGATASAAATAPVPEPVARALRILLVEDNADAREALGKLLERDGHSVKVSPDGLTAVRVAAETAPDVVLVDIGLPGMNGYEVARRIRRRLGPSVRLIALTGYGDPEARRRTRDAGFDGHLVKPVFPETLVRALGSA